MPDAAEVRCFTRRYIADPGGARQVSRRPSSEPGARLASPVPGKRGVCFAGHPTLRFPTVQ
jgi:hypothetical protein